MKKTIRIILITMIVLLTILSVQVLATDDGLTYEIGVTAPEGGVYGIGQEITLTVTFTKPIKGMMPKYAIYFGSDSTKTIELGTEEITEFTTTVEYKYTIKSGDNGELRAEGFIRSDECVIEDEDGDKYYASGGGAYKFEKVILADTTIEWTDFSNATVQMKADNGGNNAYFDVQFENCTLKSDNSYYVHLSHNENEEIVVKNSEDLYSNEFWQAQVSQISNKIYLSEELRDLFAEVGEVYVTVCEVDDATKVPKIVLNSKKVAKLPSLPLTQRITAYFFNDYTSTFCWNVYSENQKNLSYKIGKIADKKLLKSIKNGDASALTDLMEYAKNSESISTGTIKLGQDDSITDKLELVDDAYYYVYLQLETIDGKYVEIEDVSLYQALVTEQGVKNLFSFIDKDFEWKLEETEKTPESEKDPTTAEKEIPKAGLEKSIIMFVVMSAIVLVIAVKKNKKYRDII